MSEILLEMLKRLPLDALIYLIFTLVILLGITIIPFWIKRVEARMQDVHRVNQKVTSDGLRLDRVERRMRRLEDNQDDNEDKFRDLDVKLARIESSLDVVVGGQNRIMEKLNIL